MQASSSAIRQRITKATSATQFQQKASIARHEDTGSRHKRPKRRRKKCDTKPKPNRMRYNAKNATLLYNFDPKLLIQNRSGNLCSQLYTPHPQPPPMRLLRLYLRLKHLINAFRLLAMLLSSYFALPPQVQLTHSHFPHMSLAPHRDSFAGHPPHSSPTPVSSSKPPVPLLLPLFKVASVFGFFDLLFRTTYDPCPVDLSQVASPSCHVSPSTSWVFEG